MESIEAAVRNILEPYHGSLAAIPRRAWEAYRSEYEANLHVHHKRTRACLVHDHIRSVARKELDGHPGIFFVETPHLFLVNVEDKLLLRFKKINQDLKTSNIPTQQSMFFLNRGRQTEINGIPAELPKLVVGYQLNEIETDISRVLLTCPAGSTVAWHYELVPAGAEEVLFPARSIEKSLPRVRVKRDSLKELKNY